MAKNILIINGHPDKESFCTALSESYSAGAESANANVNLVHLADLTFDPILRYGYRKRTELESDLLMMQAKIKNADHIVWIYPNWWGTFPALLKGFIDRTFLPGFAFDYQEGSPMPKKLLAGKTAHLITTMDSPGWWYNLILRAPGNNAMKRSTLQFCGIKPIKTTRIGIVKGSDEKQRENWLAKVNQLGQNFN